MSPILLHSLPFPCNRGPRARGRLARAMHPPGQELVAAVSALVDVWPVGWVAVALAVVTGGAFVLRAAMLISLRRWPRSQLAASLVPAIRGPSALWCVALGLYAAGEVAAAFSFMSDRWQARGGMLLEALVVLSVTLVLAGVAGQAMAQISERTALGGGVTGLAHTSARAVVLSVGLLVLLSILGVQITPVLTALGVGGLAVALALQDSLANLFAGVHLLADKPIRVGDYVKIAEAGEGLVTDIGWRSTRIRSLANTIIVMPNQTVAKATITNYSLPDSRISLGFNVRVDYGADIDHVERTLRDELSAAVEGVRGVLREPAPSVSLIPGFGEYSLEFGIGYSVANFVDQYAVQDQLRRRILHRFRREGISMAVPTRSLHFDGGPRAVSSDTEPEPAGSRHGALPRGG
jgi:small-conductance mechanosensitive channel